jgi:hypothetical protein
MNIFTMIYFPDTIFKEVFNLFASATNGLLGYFIAKSTQDGKNATPNTVESTTTINTSKEVAPVDNLPG